MGVKIFADKFCKAQTGFPVPIENHPAWTASPITYHGRSASTRTLHTTFNISSDSIRALKQVASSLSPSSSASAAINISHPPDGQQAHSSDQATCIPTHDAIAELIWRSIMLPRHRAGILSAHTTTHFTQAVDCRIRLHLPEPFFGNANYVIKASLALSDLASTVENFDASRIVGVQAAARAIRAELSGDLLGFAERTDMKTLMRLSVLENISIGSILLVSFFGFEMHEIDFGEALGKMEAFRLLSREIFPGIPVMLPRLPDGSCEFLINEQEKVMI